MRMLSVLFVCLAMAGCVGVDQTDMFAVQGSTSATYNPNIGKWEYSSKPSGINGNILQGAYLLRGTKEKDTPIAESVHQIYLSFSEDDWLFLDEVYSDGKQLRSYQIDRKVGYCGSSGCSVSETIGVNITYDELKRYADVGITMQVNGQRGNRVVTIPATYFWGYLQAIDNSGNQNFPARPA